MAVIYLTHPVFGNKVATSDFEADYDEQNGWFRDAVAGESLDEETSDEEAPDEKAPLAPAAHGSRRRRPPAQEA